MTFTDPFWLVLAIPMAMAFWRWPLPSRLLTVLRCIASVSILLALCGFSIRLATRSGTVVLIADRSLSMPSNCELQQREAADLIHASMPSGDRLAVVSFGERAAVEQSPQAGRFAGFSATVGREASQLADAIDTALSLLDRDESGRILLMSDGLWTGRDIASSAARAAAANVALDYRVVDRPKSGDLAIERIEGPDSARPGESFMLTAWISSPRAQAISYELHRGSAVIARGTRPVPSGVSRLLFRDTAPEHGVCEYLLRVDGEGLDPATENNRARFLVGILGDRPVLCVSATGVSGLPSLLRRGGLNVKSQAVGDCRWSLEELAGYAAVIVENTPASRIGRTGMDNLAAWVAKGGGGLILTGGRDSFGPGGYYKSSLDPVIPVSMELRREHRKLALAIVVALDRSGSMAMTVPGGRAKMDLANLATAEVIDLLSPMDQFGCVAVDSAAHEIVPLSAVTNKGEMRSRVLQIDSAGGGIFIYEALKNAARMLAPAEAGAKHIVLFADAADSEQPGDYKALVAKCVKAGITISVVGLGTERDSDAELLKDVARRGGGQCMFTNVAEELPRLFAQDTLVVARSAFLDTPVAVRPVAGLMVLTRQPLGDFPAIGGYNLCYLRPTANLAVASKDEYTAPVVASWHVGLGRVLCYTGEVDGKHTGAIAKWKNVGEFFTSLARWTAGRQQSLGRGILATQELRNGVCRVELHLDPDRETTAFSSLPELTVLSARPGESAVSRKVRMNWASADVLLAELPISGSETLLNTVSSPGIGQTTLAPVCLPYSPEYLPQTTGRGQNALEQLASSTGGRERVNLSDIWRDLPRKSRGVSLASYLLIVAIVAFLLEVLQRRTALLSVRWRAMPAHWPAALRPSWRLPRLSLPRGRKKTEQIGAKSSSETATTAKSPASVPEKTTDGKGFSDVLDQARQRARRRTGR
ncbi:MAG: VWA domain-containing protein [Thermoguttaceae bacterium]